MNKLYFPSKSLWTVLIMSIYLLCLLSSNTHEDKKDLGVLKQIKGVQWFQHSLGLPLWSLHQQKGHWGSGPASLIYTLFCAEQQKRDINGRISLVSCLSDPNEPRNSDLSLRRIAPFNLQGQLIILTRTTQRCALQIFQWTGRLKRYKTKKLDGFLF